MRPAVFLDRDGTVIEHVHHLTDPAAVRLLAGSARAIRSLQSRGYRCVIVTNQSVVGRGMLTEAGLAEIHRELDRQLAEHEVQLDGLYYCPEAPRGDDRTAVEHPDRKPGPGMLLRAARDLDLDLAASWMIGDSLTDMLSGRAAGCRGNVLVRTGLGGRSDAKHPAVDHAAEDLLAAASWILSQPATLSDSRLEHEEWS